MLLIEALAMVMASSVVIRVTGGKLIRLTPRGRAQARLIAEHQAAALVRAISAVSRRLPWRTLCFEQGLAAHWMLSRRHIRSTLFYGAAMAAGELKAHVWVRSGDLDIIGCENAADFAILSQFSNDSSSSLVQP
ncbi:MAG: lasso peptide biosynthesis B2 protein [Sphingomicrobium sp.]